MKLVTAILVFMFLQGCAGVKAVGVWVENDDTRRSFAYAWHRDKDPLWQEPGEDPRIHASK